MPESAWSASPWARGDVFGLRRQEIEGKVLPNGDLSDRSRTTGSCLVAKLREEFETATGAATIARAGSPALD